MSLELNQQMLDLQPGDHLCLFYKKDAAEQMPALVPFIQDALSGNEQFIYIADDQTVDELAGRLESSGVDVAGETDRGALKLWTRREWRQPGILRSDKKSKQVLRFINQASNSGFKGIRFAVEMTWALGPDIDAAKLEHWEATLNTLFSSEFPGRIICQYNRGRLSAEVMLAALRTHPQIILEDHVHANLFYEAPLILKGRRNGKSSAAKVDWMVSRLKQSQVLERNREERVRREAALTEAEHSRKKVENVLSLMPTAVYMCDEEGRITFFNRRAAELWGREPALNEADKRFCGSFRLWRLDGSLLPHCETPMALAVKHGRPARNEEVVIERPDGSRVVVSVNIDPLYDWDGRRSGAINIFQDITANKQAETALRQAKNELARSNQELERRVSERTAELEKAQAALLRDVEKQKKLEEQLRQAQKMESVGTLAGGIAHDFNNILNIIKGYTAMLAQNGSHDATVTGGLKVIDDAIERGASVVRQMLTLARKSEPRLEATRADEVISEMALLLKQTLPKSIDVSLKLDRELPAALADPSQLTQALLNLCVNARDAMPGGGTLILGAGVIDGSELRQRRPEAESASYVCIEVADNGVGMDESLRDRIFEPFFTTKGSGEGTGLGLSIVYGVMKNHRGFIDVDSELGRGTTFRLYLPVAGTEHKPAMDQRRSKEPQIPSRPKEGATILLAEDEEPMVCLLKKVLSRHGYQILVARDGEEALELYHRHQNEIDLVLLDIGLPKITGWEVILTLKEKNPDVKVVVASGYVDPELKSQMYCAGVKSFVDKPYMPSQLVETLGSLIDSP